MLRPARPLPVLLMAMILLAPALAFAGADGNFEEYQARGWVWMYLGSFGAGFLTSLTPCVYPMIPITLGIFGARGKDVTLARRLLLATAYVVGMGLTYAVLGVTFAMLGGRAGALLSNPFVVIPICAMFVAMAASLFGAFELNLPSSWQAKLNQVGGKGFGGAFMMGLVGGFIAAPCTGPFLAGLLAFVTTTRNVVGGGTLLFVYALGMGVLFWVLAAAAMSLPKSGRWMDTVKSFGGTLLLFGAIYFLRPLLPFLRTIASPEMWFLWVAIAMIPVGIVLGAFHLTFGGSLTDKVRKSLGIALVLAGGLGIWTWKLTPKHHLPWVHDEQAAFAQARAEGKGVMVDFAADWCAPCEKLELTFGDDEVYEAITANFITLKLDVSKDTAEDRVHQENYGAQTLPAVIFLDTKGAVLGRVKDYVEPDVMLDVVRPAARKLGASRSTVTGLPWLTDEAAAFAKARAEGKGVMIHFTAAWCGPCEELEKRTYADTTVFPAITASFVPLKIDVSNGTTEDGARQDKYGARTLPAVVFVDTKGTVLARIQNMTEPAEMLAIVRPAAGKLAAP